MEVALIGGGGALPFLLIAFLRSACDPLREMGISLSEDSTDVVFEQAVVHSDVTQFPF